MKHTVEFACNTENLDFLSAVNNLNSKFKVEDTEGLIHKEWVIVDDGKLMRVFFVFENSFYRIGFLTDPLVSPIRDWLVDSYTQKLAGHLHRVRFVNLNEDTSVACGYLSDDLRGTHHHGGYRDFSNDDIRTSYLVGLEFHARTNTTIITTRNSFYFAIGDVLNLGDVIIRGRKEVSEYIKDANRTLYMLTEEGEIMTGEEFESIISENLNFTDHDLCGEGEIAFSLDDNRHSTELNDVFFLKPSEYAKVPKTQYR